MTNTILFCLTLIMASISLTKCAKTSPEKVNVMTTTEAASRIDAKSTGDISIDSKSMGDSQTLTDSKSMDNDTTKDDINVMAVMMVCNESFRIEMSYLISLNESGSFPDETDRTPKCFLRCLLQNLAVASLDDGKIDPQRAAEIFSGERNGEPEDILEITTYCAQRDEKCHCEMAYNFLKCLFSMDIEKFGIKTNS